MVPLFEMQHSLLLRPRDIRTMEGSPALITIGENCDLKPRSKFRIVVELRQIEEWTLDENIALGGAKVWGKDHRCLFAGGTHSELWWWLAVPSVGLKAGKMVSLFDRYERISNKLFFMLSLRLWIFRRCLEVSLSNFQKGW